MSLYLPLIINEASEDYGRYEVGELDPLTW